MKIKKIIIGCLCFLVFLIVIAEPRDPFENPSDNRSDEHAEVIKLKYIKANFLAQLLKNSASMGSAKGNLFIDPRTNTLWLDGETSFISKIRNFIAAIDIPQKQILIKARIISIDDSALREIGVKFGTLNLDSQSLKQDNHLQIPFARLGENNLLDVELAALQSNGRGKIISSPELMTENRLPAYIEAGEEVPYQEKTSSGATNITFKKAVLSLKVVPQIAPHDDVVLSLTLNQDKISNVTVQGVPVIRTQQIQTQVRIKNGHTLVLGGIYEQNVESAISRIAFLSHIPILGNLLKNQINSKLQKELVVFVTPYVVS